MFKKTIENFKCEHCGLMVAGDGYTNHCPACLWSMHVDNDPGDRKNPCGGLMEPLGIIKNRKDTAILHRCTKCLTKKKNRLNPNDDMEIVARLSAVPLKID